MKEFALNQKKAINTLLFICDSQGGECDLYHLLKVVFFADSSHLFDYGRPITGDRMVAMNKGPVPSYCYDVVKRYGPQQEYFKTTGNTVVALQKPDMNVFSESDIEHLKKAIAENMPLSSDDLMAKSHTPAYNKAWANPGKAIPMSYIDIAREDGKVNEEMIKYIHSRFQY